jgi:outer membrane receptor protein involved in Fe transport
MGGPPQGPPTGIAGRVLDGATGEGIPAATVAVYTDGAFVTGTAAGDDGSFVLSPLRPAAYEVRVSSVGYEPLTQADVAVRPGVVTPLGELRLTPATVQLGEAETTAERELVEQRADRTVYNVANQPVTAGGSAIETLQTLPAVEIDTDGNLSLRGNQNVAVHINGRPVPVSGAMLAGLLRQIPASNIERIEVVPNPSARNDASEMGGIINIVLKQGTNRGLSGGFTLGGGSAPNAEASGNVSYQQGPVDVTASYGYRLDSFDMQAESNRTVGLATEPRTTLQAFSMDHQFHSHLLNTTVDYTLRQGLNAIFTGSISARLGETDHFSDYTAGLQGASPDEQTQRWTDGGHDGTNVDGSIGLRREFAQGHTLNNEVRYTRNWDEDDDAFLNRVTDMDAGVSTDEVEHNLVVQTTQEAYLQTDYVRPLAGGTLEVGGKATLRQQDNDVDFANCVGGGPTTGDDVECNAGGSFVDDPNRTNQFVLDEGIYAAYVQGARSFGPVDLQLGLRMEHADRSYDLTSASGTTARDLGADTDFFPSAFATYNFGPGTLLKGSYSRRINRPRPWALNPFQSFDDPLNVRVGNPELRPEFTDAFELTAQYKYFLTLAPFYRRTTDVLRPRLTVDPTTGISTFTFANFDSDESYGADLTLMAALGQRLRGFASASVFRSVTSGGNLEAGLGSDGLGWSARGNIQAQIRPGTDLQLFAFYRAPFEVPDGHISGFGIATLGISQKLMADRATLALRVNDVLSTSRFRWRQDDPDRGYVFDGYRDPAIQQVNLSFTYTFGQAPRRRPQRQQQDQQQNGGQDTGFGF